MLKFGHCFLPGNSLGFVLLPIHMSDDAWGYLSVYLVRFMWGFHFTSSDGLREVTQIKYKISTGRIGFHTDSNEKD